MRGWGAGLAVIAIVSATVLAPSASHATAPSAAGSTNGDLTVANDVLRTAWDQNEPDLAPANVTASTFGQLFSTQLQGQVYAQPLVVNRTLSSPGTLIVATEDDNVYGLDPVDGSKRWTSSLGTPWSASVLGCGDLVPNIGVTSTPVYDPSTNSVYVMAKEAPAGPTSTNPQWYLHALNADTGLERSGWPVAIGGHPDNDPTRTFNQETAAQRPGLLLLGGIVYAGFASYCDHGPYNGYIIGVSTTTATQTALWSDEVGTTSGEAGIWQGGGGLVSDGSGQIIVSTGNGSISPLGAGQATPTALGEAVVRLAVQPDGTLKSTDWFTPSNGANLNQIDGDFGSGAPLAIPAGYGTASHPHLLVQIGKDGRAFLLDRDHLGGEGNGPGGTDDVIGVTALTHGVWGHPAFWGGPGAPAAGGGYVYLTENAGNLRALKFGVNGDGDPVLVSTANSSETFGYTSGSPVVTSDGTTAGSALVWVVNVKDGSGKGPMLEAYNAEPSGSLLTKVFSAPLNPPGVADNNLAHGTKFITLATDNGRVFVGTRDGVIFGFGHPSAAPIYAPHTDVGSVPVGSTSGPVAVTLTASRPVTVTGVSGAGPFAVTDSPASPIDLNTNDTLTVHLTLHPTVAGAQSATLTVATKEAGTPGTVSFGLSGYGTQAGLAAYPSSIGFGTVALPGHSAQGINIVNTSASPETVSSISGLTAPFTSSDLPTVGQVIPAQASVAVPLTYAPTTVASDAATLNIGVDGDAEILHVDLSGSAVVGAAKLTLKPPTLNFGLVPRGQSVTKTFQVTNQGNVLLTINIAKVLDTSGSFSSTAPVSEGQQITPDQSVVVPITFSPVSKGAAVASYKFAGTDGTGPHYETLVGIDDELTDRYLSHATLQTVLGDPTGATTKVPGGYTRRFQHGRMYWSATAGIHYVTGHLLRRYLKLGGTTSKLGFPTGNPHHVRGGTRQHFVHGTITWRSHGGYQVKN